MCTSIRKILCFALLAIVASCLPLATTAEAATIAFINGPGAEQGGDAFDNWLIARMEGFGNTVIRGGQSRPFDDPLYDNVDVFIISDDVSSSGIAATVTGDGMFGAAGSGDGGLSDPRPIIMYEGGVMDEFGIGDGEAYHFGAQTDINPVIVDVDDPSNPLLGGVTGSPMAGGDTSLNQIALTTGLPVRLHGLLNDASLATGFQASLSTVPSSGDAPFVIPGGGPSPEIVTLGYVLPGDALLAGTVGGDTAAGLRIVPFFNDSNDPSELTPDALVLIDATLGFAGISIIPEPSSLMLALLGMGAIAGRRKQRA